MCSGLSVYRDHATHIALTVKEQPVTFFNRLFKHIGVWKIQTHRCVDAGSVAKEPA